MTEEQKKDFLNSVNHSLHEGEFSMEEDIKEGVPDSDCSVIMYTRLGATLLGKYTKDEGFVHAAVVDGRFVRGNVIDNVIGYIELK